MLTSVNVSPIPFQASIDSTRLNMACRQISQSLSDVNTQIPYVISNNYRQLVTTSKLGICVAEDDGKVIFNRGGVMIVFYKNKGSIDIKNIPHIMKTVGNFASPLRFSLPKFSEFKKGDILYEYSEFTNGIPSYGYNVFVGFLPFYGYNHEDSLVISESLANKTNANFINKVYVPITEYTLLQQFYVDDKNQTGGYFPNIGERIKDGIVCCSLEPKTSTSLHISNPKNIKAKMLKILKSLSLSDIINMNSQSISNFIVNKHGSKIENGVISGIRIHKLRTDIKMIDNGLQNILENLYKKYSEIIKSTHEELMPLVGRDLTLDVLKKYFIYADGDQVRYKVNLRQAAYLIEFEITDREETKLGDKLANTCANKGVVSEILPDELRPVAIQSETPIDLMFNPFGVFSRMNLGQINEGLVGKNVMYCDRYIKKEPEKTIETLKWLNETIIKSLNDPVYYESVRTLIEDLSVNNSLRHKFVDNVRQNNLFIEAPAFAETDVDTILREGIPPNEQVLIKKETIDYFKQKLKIELPFQSTDQVLENIKCCPLYIMKLYKLTSHICNARDFGPVRQVTKQPLKGRAKSGGSRIGQMEIEAILAHGCEKSIKEFMTVKSDWTEGKKDLLRQLIESGKYVLPEDNRISSQTKQVVDVQIDFLKR